MIRATLSMPMKLRHLVSNLRTHRWILTSHGVAGVIAFRKVRSAEKAMAKVFGYIDAEQKLHEEHMDELRIELEVWRTRVRLAKTQFLRAQREVKP